MKIKNKKIIIVISATVLLAAGVLSYYLLNRNTIKFKEITVERGDIEINILATGVVAPENRLEIKPSVAGRVEEVLIKEGDAVKKGQIIAWISSTERAALLDAVQAKGEKEVKRWEDLYKPTAIMAPIDGTIIQKNVEAGQTFASTDAVFVMSDRLTVNAQVDETDIAEIKKDQQAAVVLDAYSGQPFNGHVDQIAYDAKTVNNVTTYVVEVLPDAVPSFMRSGMTANITFHVTEKKAVVTVPNELIHIRGSQSVVNTRSNETNQLEDRVIKIGATDGKKTEVISGLNEGDVLVVPMPKQRAAISSGSSPLSPFGSRPRPAGGAGH